MNKIYIDEVKELRKVLQQITKIPSEALRLAEQALQRSDARLKSLTKLNQAIEPNGWFE